MSLRLWMQIVRIMLERERHYIQRIRELEAQLEGK